MRNLFFFIFAGIACSAFSQTVTVTVNATQGLKQISPWIYGRNNNASDNSGSPVSASDWLKYNEAGLRFYRENGGNNSTKYNWRLKLTSHPDWYNNVYSHDWDYCVSSILANTPNTQAIFALQLLGKVASNKNNNFDDWTYNGSAWWAGVSNNWAGGGGPVAGEGNPNLYLKNWPADSTTGILKHFFTDLKLDSTRLRYWNMDNEPEVWSSTHDDIADSTITAEVYMQKFFAVAKAARKQFPGIKIVGPVSTNEWQWYTWDNVKVTDTTDGKKYCWIEYFIKRIGEEQKKTGIRLLDVLDFHFYPGTGSDPDLTLQLHRLWYDTQWNYSKANGVKVSGSFDWDNNITKEYLFERCNQWLIKYIGANHNVSCSLSEYGDIATPGSEDPNIIACWYASHLGVFAYNNVELFSPWDWYKGMWEVLHLYSRYYGQLAVGTTSSLENTVSGYSSMTKDKDSLMVVIVNRDRSNSRNVSVAIQNKFPAATSVNALQLSNLPVTETYVSDKQNALQKLKISLSGNNFSISVPKLSVTLLQIPVADTVMKQNLNTYESNCEIYPNPARDYFMVSKSDETFNIAIYDDLGRIVKTANGLSDGKAIDVTALVEGLYYIEIKSTKYTEYKRLSILRK